MTQMENDFHVQIDEIKESLHYKAIKVDNLFDFYNLSEIKSSDGFCEAVQSILDDQLRDFRLFTDKFENSLDFKLYLVQLGINFDQFKFIIRVQQECADDPILSQLERLWVCVKKFFGKGFLEFFQSSNYELFYIKFFQKVLQSFSTDLKDLQTEFQNQFLRNKRLFGFQDKFQFSQDLLVPLLTNNVNFQEFLVLFKRKNFQLTSEMMKQFQFQLLLQDLCTENQLFDFLIQEKIKFNDLIKQIQSDVIKKLKIDEEALKTIYNKNTFFFEKLNIHSHFEAGAFIAMHFRSVNAFINEPRPFNFRYKINTICQLNTIFDAARLKDISGVIIKHFRIRDIRDQYLGYTMLLHSCSSGLIQNIKTCFLEEYDQLSLNNIYDDSVVAGMNCLHFLANFKHESLIIDLFQDFDSIVSKLMQQRDSVGRTPSDMVSDFVKFTVERKISPLQPIKEFQITKIDAVLQ